MSSARPPHFSRRTDWERHPNALTEAWRRRLESGRPAEDLTESNPTRCDLGYPVERILRALADPRGLTYAPEPLGLPQARAAAAAHVGADPDRLLLSASTSEAYGWLLKLLCERGDRVLVPRPSYPLFDFLAGLEDVELRSYPLGFDGRWHLDAAAVAEQIDERTRAVIVVHPNNPTGSALSRAEAAALAGLCAERGLALISDEVFLEYLDPPDLEPASSHPADPLAAGSLAVDSPALTFSLGGLSKSVGLPQIKVGWIHVGGPSSLVDEAMARLEVVADTYLSVNTPAQWALPELLAAGASVRGRILARITANRCWLERQTEGRAWQVLPADGGWSAVLRVPQIRTEEEWCVLLVEEEGVLLHPGYFFDFEGEGILVASLLPPEARFRAAIERASRHFI